MSDDFLRPIKGMPELVEALSYVGKIADQLADHTDLACKEGPLTTQPVIDTGSGETTSLPKLTMVLAISKQMIDALVFLRTAIHAMGIDGEGHITVSADTTNVVMMTPDRYAQAGRFFNPEAGKDGEEDGPDAA